MPNDQQIADNKTKDLISKLKQTQTLEKMSADEKAPESASAARELIERLRGPREPEIDFSALAPLASPRVAQSIQAPALMSPEEQRLSAAATLENSLAKVGMDSGKKDERRYYKDRSTFEKAYDQAGGVGRGSKLQRDLKEQTNLLSDAEDMINDIVQRGDALTPQVARDFSQLMTRSMSGGSPAIQLVEATIMKNLSGAAKSAFQYMTSKPTKNYLGKASFGELQTQFGRLYQQKKSHYYENVAMQRNKIKGVSEEFINQFDAQYGEAYDVDESGNAEYKRLGGYGSAKMPEDRSQPASKAAAQPAPGGNEEVFQKGKKFKWNGNEYVESR